MDAERRSAHKGREARPWSLKTFYWSGGSPGNGADSESMRKFRCARRGGGACCYNRQHSEPGVVPGNSKWEIPDKGINMSNQRSVNDLCKEREMSSDELAAQSGLDPQRSLAIVQGQYTPSPDDRDRVAAVFELTKDQIAWGHKTPIQHIRGH